MYFQLKDEETETVLSYLSKEHAAGISHAPVHILYKTDIIQLYTLLLF